MASETKIEKWKRIIDVYFTNGFNGTQAYLKVEPHVKEATARVEFSKLLTNPNIQEYLQQKHKEAKKLSGIEHKHIVDQLVNFAFADVTQFMCLTPEQIKELPEEVRQLITSMKVVKRSHGKGKNKVVIEEVQLKFASKERALDMLAKHVGFYEEHNYQKNAHLTREERQEKISELKQKLALRKVS